MGLLEWSILIGYLIGALCAIAWAGLRCAMSGQRRQHKAVLIALAILWPVWLAVVAVCGVVGLAEDFGRGMGLAIAEAAARRHLAKAEPTPEDRGPSRTTADRAPVVEPVTSPEGAFPSPTPIPAGSPTGSPPPTDAP